MWAARWLKLHKNWGMHILLNDLPREGKRRKTAVLFPPVACGGVRYTHLSRTFYIEKGSIRPTTWLMLHFFRSLKRRPVIINTSRGEVIETNALLNALETGAISDAVIDVWENEPAINIDLLDKVFLGTPILPATRQTVKPTPPACRWMPYAVISIYKRTTKLFRPLQNNRANHSR